jgi:hypothetical protein
MKHFTIFAVIAVLFAIFSFTTTTSAQTIISDGPAIVLRNTLIMPNARQVLPFDLMLGTRATTAQMIFIVSHGVIDTKTDPIYIGIQGTSSGSWNYYAPKLAFGEKFDTVTFVIFSLSYFTADFQCGIHFNSSASMMNPDSSQMSLLDAFYTVPTDTMPRKGLPFFVQGKGNVGPANRNWGDANNDGKVDGIDLAIAIWLYTHPDSCEAHLQESAALALSGNGTPLWAWDIQQLAADISSQQCFSADLTCNTYIGGIGSTTPITVHILPNGDIYADEVVSNGEISNSSVSSVEWKAGQGINSPNKSGFFTGGNKIPAGTIFGNLSGDYKNTSGFLNNNRPIVFKSETTTGVKNSPAVIPTEFKLAQNYPNPFNPTTTIRFSIPAAGHTKLTVSNILGQEVATLIDGENLAAGEHEAVFNASNLPSGIYFYRLTSAGKFAVGRMTLLK